MEIDGDECDSGLQDVRGSRILNESGTHCPAPILVVTNEGE